MKKTLIVVIGPTAVGKTELAITIAKKFKTAIISADSRQFFKELNIGVARPTEEQLQEIKHHFVAFRSVQDAYTEGRFEEDVIKLLEKLFQHHDIVVMVGGSGLYIQAVCGGDLIRQSRIIDISEPTRMYGKSR